MIYYDKYNKYKTKYLELKNNNLIGGNNNNTYQNIIYEIAKYIKPNISNKFKKNYGIKQLSNQVIELDKIKFFNELQDITNYYITDKINGKRTILYITNQNSYAVSDDLINIDISTQNICILDTELYEDNYYVFDIMVYEGNNLINMPFFERMKYFDKFNNFNIIKTKPFIKLDNNFKQQIRDFKNEQKDYDIDGIILTPNDGKYNSMKVYKYKPPNELTIDFLIKKCPPKLSELFKIKTDKFVYLLFSGISKRTFYKLRMRLIKYYDKIFPNIDIKKLPHYFPIQFTPSNNNKNAYIFISDNKLLDGEIGEFLYNIDNKEWILKRLREDRKIEVERGNYFGNNYKIAESIWMSLSDPLIIEDIKEENIYFQEHDNILQKASRNYNSFVKSEILKMFKGTEWVMDLASGKGQDLFRYSNNNIKNVIFLEIDKMALSELISRKHIFSTDEKYKNSMNILIQNVDLLDNYKDNIKAINNVYTNQNIDLIMCNFALHYFMKNNKLLENICKLINHYLKQNGKFVFTAFDGNKIINLLEKNNGEWIIKVDNQIKYGITKKYDDSDLTNIGQKIEVLLPFSKNTYYEEYLININTISKALSKYDIILEQNESFSKFMNSYKQNLDENDKIYIDLYHYYIFKKK